MHNLKRIYIIVTKTKTMILSFSDIEVMIVKNSKSNTQLLPPHYSPTELTMSIEVNETDRPEL